VVVEIGRRPSRLLLILGHGRGGRPSRLLHALGHGRHVLLNPIGVVAGLPFRVKGGVGKYDFPFASGQLWRCGWFVAVFGHANLVVCSAIPNWMINFAWLQR